MRWWRMSPDANAGEAMIDVQRDGGVVVLKLNRSAINSINLEMVRALAGELEEVRADAGVMGLVLASASSKFFAMGFDLPELLELDRAGMEEFYHEYNELCLALHTLPKPTVAAVESRAVGGGCILAICCDYRYMAEESGLMGLPEVKIGVPVPYLAQRILREIAGGRSTREVAYGGELYGPEELLRLGLVDSVLKRGEVLPEAISRAKELGAMPARAFASIKSSRTGIVERLFEQNGAVKQKVFLDCWFSEETRPLLSEAAEKFKPKK
jgi:enoyl-CoA hydratase/carnithine racemase